jgi:hypothetical protein
MKHRLHYLEILPLVLLASCANPYREFYQGMSREQILVAPNLEPAPKEPMVLSGSGLNPDAIESDRVRFLENGFAQVGFSSFNAGATKADGAKKLAKRLGAHLVVLYSQYTHTVSGVIPLVQQVPQTSRTYQSGNVYAPGVWGSYSGTSQTYSSSSVVTPIPYAIARFDYGATYWVKLRAPVFGAVVMDIPSERTGELGCSSGAIVDVVMNDSPARGANILRGDVITRLGDRQVTGQQSFLVALEAYAGQEVDLTLVRQSEEHVVHITLNKGRVLPVQQAAGPAR